MNLKYSEIIKQNVLLGNQLNTPKFRISILSNIVVDNFVDILEYSLRIEGINAICKVGNYNNILLESQRQKETNLVIIIWEATNISEGLQYRINTYKDIEYNVLIENVKAEIISVLENLKTKSLVLFNRFSSIAFRNSMLTNSNYDRFCMELNSFLNTLNYTNVIYLDIDAIIAKTGLINSIDYRFYYSSKSLYSIPFIKNYAETIKPAIRSVLGKTKKVLVFDCDNTLWKGVLGEDGERGIEMSSKTHNGKIFNEIQHIALDLYRKGVLLGICSKNNELDVIQILENHQDMIVGSEMFIAKKINWKNKTDNLLEMAQELNLGLDSFVMVDDSDFELSLLSKMLPEIELIKVPSNLAEYPSTLRNAYDLFFKKTLTHEDWKRNAMYNEEIVRNEIKKNYTEYIDYLKSLKLVMTINTDQIEYKTRISQLTQKTNQFNLTTKRYTETDIENFIIGKDFKVFSFHAKDRFGDYGQTGVCIVKQKDNSEAEIDTFLMSCRVIGRNLEIAFFNYIIELLKSENISHVTAQYCRTLKNKQVEDFYKKFGFVEISRTEQTSDFILNIKEFIHLQVDYIEVKHESKNSESNVRNTGLGRGKNQ